MSDHHHRPIQQLGASTSSAHLLNSFPAEIMKNIDSNLKPHEIVHYRDVFGFESGLPEKHWTAQRAERIAAKTKLIGKPLCPKAEYFLSLIGDVSPVYKYIEECVEVAEECHNRKYHIIAVGFDIDHDQYEADFVEGVSYPAELNVVLSVRVLVRPGIDFLDAYRKTVFAERHGGPLDEQPWGRYSILKPFNKYIANGGGWGCKENDYLASDFYRNAGFDEWLDEEHFLSPTFSFAPDGTTLRQHKFIHDNAGETTFPLWVGEDLEARVEPYDPRLHPFQLAGNL